MGYIYIFEYIITIMLIPNVYTLRYLCIFMMSNILLFDKVVLSLVNFYVTLKLIF